MKKIKTVLLKMRKAGQILDAAPCPMKDRMVWDYKMQRFVHVGKKKGR